MGIERDGKLSDWWFAYPDLKYKYDVFLKPYEVNQKVDTRIPVYKHILIGGSTAGVVVGNTLNNPIYAVVIFDLPLKDGIRSIYGRNNGASCDSKCSQWCFYRSTKKKLTFEISHIGQKHKPDEFKVEWNGCTWTHKKMNSSCIK